MIKLEQAARQALEALEAEFYDDVKQSKLSKTITALQKALAEPKRYNHETGSTLVLEQAEHPVSQEQSYYEGFKCGAETVQLVIDIENEPDPEDFKNMDKNND